MKRCPKCKRVYRDETLLYCLDDGNPLLEDPTSDQSPTAFFQRSRERTPILDGVTKPLPGVVRASTPPAASIAVLPFAHLSKDPDDEYFCDGMAEELINALARIRMSEASPPISQISHYRIVSRLGAGGMGEVYRAHDSRLDRDVAIKVLPQDFASDPERLARTQCGLLSFSRMEKRQF